ncbi:hypothetical protein K440DRAFT_670663 [Wilcoxina mikolae CBS 423.85]|nr:hypothetical protein K440DRAFT_670663 [Wilcoxina mikolae CBS 423.85]
MGIHQEIQEHKGKDFYGFFWGLVLWYKSNYASAANAVMGGNQSHCQYHIPTPHVYHQENSVTNPDFGNETSQGDIHAGMANMNLQGSTYYSTATQTSPVPNSLQTQTVSIFSQNQQYPYIPETSVATMGFSFSPPQTANTYPCQYPDEVGDQ